MKLTKAQLSLNLNVSDITIYLWERNKVKPSLAQIPKIIEFLGRDPFEKETDKFGDKIKEYRRLHGLTQKKLAEQLGIDPSTLAGLEKREYKPTKKLLSKYPRGKPRGIKSAALKQAAQALALVRDDVEYTS